MTAAPPLMQLLTEKLKYLKAAASHITQNIAAADISGARRLDIKPFSNILTHTRNGVHANLDKARIQTNEMISREGESLALGQVSMEYQSLIGMYRRYHDMVKLVIGKN